jgi:hypothetical protein
MEQIWSTTIYYSLFSQSEEWGGRNRLSVSCTYLSESTKLISIKFCIGGIRLKLLGELDLNACICKISPAFR